MSVNYQRAIILQQQGRFADAEKELRQGLAGNPQDAFAHAMLSLCLSEQKRLPEATQEAEWAIGLGPDLGLGHFALSKALFERNRFDEAEKSIRQAIDLEPYDADHFAMLSSICIATTRWQAALEAADQGLAIDPEHAGCTNLRAMALVKLGRRQEAGTVLGDSLAKNPQNAFTHANQGWALLHRGDYRKALEHFTESLRLDPGYDWARAGLVEALKARNVIYRWLLMYFLWMSRLSGRAQAGIIFGGWFGYQLVRGAARSNPELQPYLMPLIVAYIGFAYLTWLTDPLFNLTLRLNRYGKHALSDDQRRGANLVGLILIAAVCAVVIGWAAAQPNWYYAAILIALMSLPASLIYRCQRGWPRGVMAAVNMVMASCLVLRGLCDAGLIHDVLGNLAVGGFLLLLVLTVFGGQFLARVTPRQ